jgi:hypothetical protein
VGEHALDICAGSRKSLAPFFQEVRQGHFGIFSRGSEAAEQRQPDDRLAFLWVIEGFQEEVSQAVSEGSLQGDKTQKLLQRFSSIYLKK